MKPIVPRIAAVHDMSCFGRCSLSVIMPVLSCMGLQVCPLPTAIFSTHLGGFTNIAYCDLTQRMEEFFNHWHQEKITFDCIYSGFLASEQQIDIVSRFIDKFSGNLPLVLVDPVMGDEGKLYSVYNATMQEQMRKLVCKADIITPNFTEAGFLLGEQYQAAVEHKDFLKEWLIRLAGFGPSMVVITGIPVAEDMLLNMGYEKSSGCFFEVASDYVPAKYPGTGDIFASVLIGALLQGKRLPAAMQQAVDFVALCVQTTFAARTSPREGVLLELALFSLCKGEQ